jgi:serine/threonine-protein kinase
VGSPQVAQRFRAEIKLARRVTHRNVCRIHDYGEDGSLAFISMELVDGVDLKRLVREQRDLSRDEMFDIALQLADGLQAIHDVGIIHRDFKTANAMIDRRGTVRLMDFGIARLWEADSTDGLTLQGHTAGTPEYMSPEQASGEALDPRSDIYSLGLVLFELFTGIRPFAADHVAAVIYKQLHDEPPWGAPPAAALSPALQTVIRKAVAKQRDDRFASAAELRHALEESRGRSPAVLETKETLVVRVRALGAAAASAPAMPADPSGVPGEAAGAVVGVPPRGSGISRRTWTSLAVVVLALTVMAGVGSIAWRVGRLANAPTKPVVDNPPAVVPTPSPTSRSTPVEPARPPEPAKPTLEAQCDKGDPSACFAVARQLETGESVRKDVQRAAALYQKACDGDVAAACTQLGVLRNSGIAGERDLGLAAALYERGCKLGDMAGCSNLGTLYQFGSLGFRDRARAESLYEKACSAANAEACTNLALLYLDDSASSAHNRSRARGLLTNACAAGVSRACQRLSR